MIWIKYQTKNFMAYKKIIGAKNTRATFALLLQTKVIMKLEK